MYNVKLINKVLCEFYYCIKISLERDTWAT